MTLSVIERQTTTTWYELCGELEASEVFPNLLPNSNSIAEVEDDMSTEPEESEGRYDGCPQDDSEMEEEIAEFTERAIAGEFHDEALAAAKAVLTALKPGETIRREHFEEVEQKMLDEAVTALGINTPWDPAEAAEIAAAVAAEKAAEEAKRQARELRKRQTVEALVKTIELLKDGGLPEADIPAKVTELLRAGASHSAVNALFPRFHAGNIVGQLRKEGVNVPTNDYDDKHLLIHYHLLKTEDLYEQLPKLAARAQTSV